MFHPINWMPPMTDEDIMTVRELAAYLKIPEKTVYRYASEAKVPGFKVGGSWRFRKSEIDRRFSGQDSHSAPVPAVEPGPDSGRRHGEVLENKLGITDQADLAREEERISKKKAQLLYDTGDINKSGIGTFAGLSYIHEYLLGDIYDFAGRIRTVNISKNDFRFAPLVYLETALENIDAMPQGGFDEIIEKYVEMNVAHPFREGNGRATRIWLDLILRREIRRVVDWNSVDKEKYLSAMRRSVVNDTEIKALLERALTDRVDDRGIYMKGIDASYYYEGYNEYKTEDL